MLFQLSKLEHKFRPFLFKVFPKKFMVLAYSLLRNKFLKNLSKQLDERVILENKKISLFNLNFRNDLGNASGFDKDGLLLEFNYKLGAGFALIGTVLEREHSGNCHKFFGKKYNPWIYLPNSKSAINSLGLPSCGIEKVLDNIKRFRDKYQVTDFPIGLSIAGHPLDEQPKQIEGLVNCLYKARKEVDFFEINQSCPNVLNQNKDINQLSTLSKVINEIKKPCSLKYNSLSLENIELIDKLGFQAISLVNTQNNYSEYIKNISLQDKKIFEFYVEKYKGGISGQAIKDFSFETIKKIHQYIKKKNLSLKLIHIGGISDKEDVLESRKYATIRQWYTGLMEKILTDDLKTIYKKIIS